MKRFTLILFAVIISSINIMFLKADCDDAYREANAVSRTVMNIDDGEDLLTVRTRVDGITENIYAVVINDYNDIVRTYHYSDTDEGSFSFDTDDIHENINYIIRVYTEDTSCTVEPTNTLTLKTSKFNIYSTSDYCTDNPGIDICDSFYDVGNMTINEFNKEVQEKINNMDKPLTLLGFISKYYLFVLIPFILIVGFYIVRIILFKRGKKND